MKVNANACWLSNFAVYIQAVPIIPAWSDLVIPIHHHCQLLIDSVFEIQISLAGKSTRPTLCFGGCRTKLDVFSMYSTCTNSHSTHLHVRTVTFWLIGNACSYNSTFYALKYCIVLLTTDPHNTASQEKYKVFILNLKMYP